MINLGRPKLEFSSSHEKFDDWLIGLSSLLYKTSSRDEVKGERALLLRLLIYILTTVSSRTSCSNSDFITQLIKREEAINDLNCVTCFFFP